MPVPLGELPPNVAAYLQELEDRIGLLENPTDPVLVPAFTSAGSPDASAYHGRVIRDTTLNILAHSDGTNWIRQDTGAAI